MALWPSLLVSPLLRSLADASQTLSEMISRILFVLAAPFERPDTRIPLVVASKAIPGAGDTEGRVAAGQSGQRPDDPHHRRGLLSLDLADKRQQEMQAELDLILGVRPPAPIRFAALLLLPNPGDL